MYFKYLNANALTWKKALQPAIPWKWTALKEFNCLATKSLSAFFKVSLLTYQIFPVSATIKLNCRSVATLFVRIKNLPKSE